MENKTIYLKIAGILSLITSILHIAIIFGGPDWYRFFGAGEKMAILVEQGSIRPTINTSILATIFFIWALYAWSGSGYLLRFPFIRTGLVLITSAYIIRGSLGFVVPFISNHPRVAELSLSFWLLSSSICLVFGIVHLKGILDVWPSLSKSTT